MTENEKLFDTIQNVKGIASLAREINQVLLSRLAKEDTIINVPVLKEYCTLHVDAGENKVNIEAKLLSEIRILVRETLVQTVRK